MTALTEWESKLALGPGLPRPAEVLARDLAQGLEFAARQGPPLVAKASGLAHKTERGAVRTGLDAAGLEACWDELAGLGDGSVLVAEQVLWELELIVGGIRDPQFGPVVSIGLGGVAAEVFGDVAFVLSPPEPGELAAAIRRLRCAPLLEGHRGAAPVDRAALEAIVEAVSRLLEKDPSVVEVDCNPVLVAGGRPLVADALVVRG